MTIERRADFLGITIESTTFEPGSQEPLRDIDFKKFRKRKQLAALDYEIVEVISSEILKVKRGYYNGDAHKEVIFRGEQINEANIGKPRNHFGVRISYRYSPPQI